MDTLVIHRRLVDAGADPKLAEAITTTIVDVVDGRAASKADVQEVRLDLRTPVNDLKISGLLALGAGLTLLFLALEYASRS